MRRLVAVLLAGLVACAATLTPSAGAAAQPAGTAAPAVIAAGAVGTPVAGPTVRASFPSGKPRPPDISATAAFMIDAKTGEYLFSHNANARLPMASTTKIMTAVLALESLDLDKKVKVSANAVSTIGSKASLVAGETLTVEQLLYALMVVSGNDASVALAEAVSGSVKAFVEKMNAKAKELGLTNTHFTNACGLNNYRHFASAKDLAFLAQYALQNPVFAKIVDTIYFSLPPIPPVPPSTKETLRKFDNQNELLKQVGWVTGVKTGSTPYAHYCLVSSGSSEGVSVIAVLLGAKSDSARWKESKALLTYGLSLYPRTVLVDKGDLIAEVDAGDPLGRTITLAAEKPLVVRLFRDAVATSSVELTRPVTPLARVGEAYGTITFALDGESLGAVNLVVARSLERPTFSTILSYWHSKTPYYERLLD